MALFVFGFVASIALLASEASCCPNRPQVVSGLTVFGEVCIISTHAAVAALCGSTRLLDNGFHKAVTPTLSSM